MIEHLVVDWRSAAVGTAAAAAVGCSGLLGALAVGAAVEHGVD